MRSSNISNSTSANKLINKKLNLNSNHNTPKYA